MAEIEFIYFDLGMVILGFDHDIGCRAIADQAGITSEAVRSAIFDSGLEEQYETGLVDDDQFHAAFCETAKCEIDKDALLRAGSDIFSPNRPVFSLITQLRTVNFPIGILSNTCSAHWNFVQSKYLILREFFDPLILSYEVQSMKPDAKIYQRAIENSGCSANKIFFVDDRPENVQGALEAGLDAVLYESPLGLVRALTDRGVRVNG